MIQLPVVLRGRLLLDFLLFPCFEETGIQDVQSSRTLISLIYWMVYPGWFPLIPGGWIHFCPGDISARISIASKPWSLEDDCLWVEVGKCPCPRLGIFDMMTAVAYVFFRDAVRNVCHHISPRAKSGNPGTPTKSPGFIQISRIFFFLLFPSDRGRIPLES